MKNLLQILVILVLTVPSVAELSCLEKVETPPASGSITCNEMPFAISAPEEYILGS